MIAPRTPGWRPCTAPASRHTSPAPLTPCRSDWGALFFSSCLFLFVLSPSFLSLRAYSAPLSRLAITRASHTRYPEIDVLLLLMAIFYLHSPGQCRHERLFAPSGVIFRLLFRSCTIRIHSLHKRLIFLAGERKYVSCRRCLKGVMVRPLCLPRPSQDAGAVKMLSTFYRSGGFPYAYC